MNFIKQNREKDSRVLIAAAVLLTAAALMAAALTGCGNVSSEPYAAEEKETEDTEKDYPEYESRETRSEPEYGNQSIDPEDGEIIFTEFPDGFAVDVCDDPFPEMDGDCIHLKSSKDSMADCDITFGREGTCSAQYRSYARSRGWYGVDDEGRLRLILCESEYEDMPENEIVISYDAEGFTVISCTSVEYDEAVYERRAKAQWEEGVNFPPVDDMTIYLMSSENPSADCSIVFSPEESSFELCREELPKDESGKYTLGFYARKGSLMRLYLETYNGKHGPEGEICLKYNGKSFICLYSYDDTVYDKISFKLGSLSSIRDLLLP